MARTAPEGPALQNSSRLALRKGVWYAGEERCPDYREALKKTLTAAAIALPEPPPKPAKYRAKPSLRLELRPWWSAFLVERAARERLRKTRERTLRERWLEQVLPQRKAASA